MHLILRTLLLCCFCIGVSARADTYMELDEGFALPDSPLSLSMQSDDAIISDAAMSARNACYDRRVRFDYLVKPLIVDRGISSAFGLRERPCDGCSKNHQGVDIKAKEGADIYAASSGVIVKTAFTAGHCGEMIVEQIEHGYLLKYCHLSKVNVREGQHVGYHTVIGLVGHTGGHVTGPHLHLQLFKDGAWIDPVDYMCPRDSVPKNVP